MLEAASNHLKSLTSLQNHLIHQERNHMDFLIIHKLLKNKKNKIKEFSSKKNK